MLDPDYLDRAGDMVAAVYGEIEADMLAHLCRLLLDKGAEGLGQRGSTALNLLAQSAAPQLMAFIERHREDANRAVLRTVEDALGRSDRTDLWRMPKDARDAAGRTLPRQVELTARGIAEILARDNVDMAQGALSLWNRCVAEAAAKVNTGAETAERAIHQSVRRMMREGISTITYRDAETGRQTVVNRIDVAVRRHVRTQIAQDGMRRTLDVCGGVGIRLVEVSSHGGARPSHAKWQGRVYSLDGDVEIDGVCYRDFYRETGYGKVDGLGGANCRHSFGPWIPGTPRMYSPNPDHPSGLPSDEVYRLTQGQRRRERDIRQTKRELAGAQLIADKDASMANIAEVEKLKAKLRGQQDGLRRHIEEANRKGKAAVLQRSPNREWAGDMPRVRKTDASRRTMREFMDGDGVKRALKAKGVSKTAAQKALAEELKAQGLDARSWQHLSKANQRGIFKRALSKLKGTKTATPGKHAAPFKKIKGAHTQAQDLTATNPRYSEGLEWQINCQRCVGAYEMRRRGYDVTAKPRPMLNGVPDPTDELPNRNAQGGWPKMFENATLEKCSSDSGANTKKKVETLMQSYGDGSRAIVRVQFQKKYGGGGHVFIAEQRNGATVFIDPQTGSTDCSRYFPMVKKNETYCMRIDDKKFTDLIKEAAEEMK